VLSLPALSSVAMGNLPSTRGVTFTVSDGSRLELPSLTGVIGQGLVLAAGGGGAIDAPQLTGTLNRARISASGDGVISVPLLTGLVNSSVELNNQRTGFGNFLTNIDGTSFSLQGNTSVTLGNVVGTVSDTPERGLSFRGDAGVFSLPAVTSLSTRPSNQVEMSASLGRLEFPVLQSITGGARVLLSANVGGQLQLPQLTSTGPLTVSAFGAGTRLELPSLVTSGPLVVAAQSGGQVNLPSLRTIEGAGTISITMSAGSQASLSEITQTSGVLTVLSTDATLYMDRLLSLAPGSSISASGSQGGASLNNGVFFPRLSSMQRVTVSLRGSAQFQTGQLTSINNSVFEISDGASFAYSGIIDTFSTTYFGQTTFRVGLPGSTGFLSLPGIRALHNDSVSAADSLSISVGGGLLDLSGVTQLTARAPAARTTIATTGGRVDLSGLQTAQTGLRVTAGNGQVDLSALRTINVPAVSEFTALGTGLIRLNSLESVVGGPGTSLSFSGSDTSIVAPLLRNIAGVNSFSLNASGGVFNPGLIESIGSGGFLTLSAGGSGSAPGVLRLSLLQTVGTHTRQTISTTGLTSQIILPSLTSLGTSTQRRLIELRGGSLVVPALTQILDTDFQISGAGAIEATGALTSVDGSTFSIGTNFSLSSGVVSYSPRALPVGPILSITSTGATANFSSLRSITAGLSSAERSLFVVNAAGGTVDLSGLTTVNPINAGGVDFTVASGGTVRLNALTSLAFSRLTIAGTGQIVAPLLQNLDAGAVRVSSGGVFTSVPGAASYRTGELPGSTTNVTRTIFSATSGGRLNLASLLSLEFGRPSTPGAFYTISSTGANSRIDLSGLQSLTPVNGGGLILSTSDSGTIQLGPVTTLNRVFLGNTNAAPFVLPSSLTNIDESEFSGSVTVPLGVRSYTSVNSSTNRTPLSAGSSGVISMPGVERMTLGSNVTPDVVHTLRSDGGRISLPSVQHITLVNNARLELLASQGTTGPLIDLSSLQSLTRATVSLLSPSNTPVTTPNLLLLTSLRSATASTFSLHAPMNLPALESLDFSSMPAGDVFVTGSSTTRMDRLSRVTVGSTTTSNTVTTIAARNTGAIVAPWLSTFESVNGGITRLEVISGTITLPTLTVSPLMKVATTGATPAQQAQQNGLILSGSLLNRSTDYRDFDLWRGTVSFLPGTNALLEAAGPNAGAGLPSGDFVGVSGIGQLRIGAPNAAAAAITVIDLFNNGRRLGASSEALYLFGPQSSVVAERDGLILQGGSRLILSPNVDVYAAIDGVLTNLRGLIPAGQSQVAFGGGFIVIPTPSATTAMLLLASALPRAARRRRTA
jgi:hypothetical protein